MTEDAAAEKTRYRLLRKIDTSDAAILTIAEQVEQLPEGTVLYALLPEELTGNVKRQAHEQHGEGEYAKVASRSFDEFPVREKLVVSFT